jgi:hypothetical protein
MNEPIMRTRANTQAKNPELQQASRLSESSLILLADQRVDRL